MGVITVDDFRANISEALGRAELGEAVLITRDGKPVVELRPAYPRRPARNAVWHAAYRRMLERMENGIFSEPIGDITYEDKHGPAAL